MKTCVRWIIGILFILAVSIFLLILALPFLYDPNDYKTDIAGLIQRKTGKEVTFNGIIKLEVSSLLKMSCDLGPTRLAGNASFPNSAYLESERTKLEIFLWPLLLQRRLHMSNISLDGVTLNLLRNKDGLGNWEGLAATPASEEILPPDPGQELPLLSTLLMSISGIELGRLHLSNVDVRYENRQTGQTVTLNNLQLSTGKLREKIPSPIDADFNLSIDNDNADRIPEIRSADVTLQGNATLFLDQPHLLLEDLRLDATLKGKKLPKRGLKLFLAANSDFQLPQQKILLKDFTLAHEGINIQGSGTLENFSAPQVDLTLTIPECSLHTFLKQLKDQPLPLTDDTFSRFQAAMHVKAGPELVELADIALTMDKTTLTGTATITTTPLPAYTVSLHADHLDLGRYLPEPPSALDSKKAQIPPARAPESKRPLFPAIPVNVLRALDLQLNLQLDSLQKGEAVLNEAQLHITGKEGVIELTPFSARIQEGTIKIEAGIDVTGESPQVRIKQKFSKIPLGPLVAAFTDQEEITGTASLQTEVSSRGGNPDELLRHLEGTLRLELLNGEIGPLQILPTLQAALATHKGLPAPEAATETTNFIRCTATGVINNGVLHSDDFLAASGAMQISGAGDINLADRRIDSLFHVTLSPYFDPDNAKGLHELSGRPIPLTIAGPLANPRREADVTAVLGKPADPQPPAEPTPPTEPVPEAQPATENAPEPGKLDTTGD